jgi:transglutaminase-like putative cysteine protease
MSAAPASPPAVAEPLVLRVALYLLVADGLVALHLADILSAPVALAVAAAAAATWSPPAALTRLGATPRLSTAVAILAAGVSLLDLIHLAHSALDALARLLIFLLLYRLLTRSALKDVRDIAFLSFFMLVVAAPATSGVGFLFAFLAFLVLGTWTLMLYHVLSESERAGGGRRLPERVGRDLLGLSVVAAAATIVITTVLFFVIPRVGQAALPLRGAAGRMVTGFSERVELGSLGEIERDTSVVMRVHVPDEHLAPEQLPGLRWRGIVFDRFDGRAWSVGEPARALLQRTRGGPPVGQWIIGPYRGTGPILRQEVYLEPLGSQVLFAAPRALRFSVRADEMTVDDMGSVAVSSAASRLHYVVESELEADRGRFHAGGWSRPVDAATRARYLELPPLPPRIEALARKVAGDLADPAAAAARLSEHLATTYRYTLVLDRTTTLDPVDEFLFVRRSGNCEYFAAALAVMLRSIGIPARVVGGFQRGEWNPYGRYFMVRFSDAHSWVEAWSGTGWITFDPSPRVAADGAGAGGLAMYLDALRTRWYRYVVNWSVQDQAFAALKVRDLAIATRDWKPAWPRASLSWPVLATGLAVLALVAGVAVWRVARPPAGARAAAPPVPAFYRRALRALARRALRPAPGETAREFAERVARAEPAWAPPVARLTVAYERVRFGGGGPPPAAEIDASLAALERR